MAGEAMGAGRGCHPLLLWAPSRLVRELHSFCLPELQEQYRLAALQRSSRAAGAGGGGNQQRLPPLASRPAGDGLLAEFADHGDRLDLPLLLAAARQCTLLSAVLQPIAAAPTLEATAAAAAAIQHLPGGAECHPLRVLSLDSSTARAPTERFVRKRLQQLGVGSAPAPGQSPLWCIQRAASDGQQSEVLLGLELAAGVPPLSTAANNDAARQLGPTAMLPELAAVSASLAAVQPGSTVLDPFCGSCSLLAAALQRGAALAVGSDIDATHFGTGSSGSRSGSDSSGSNSSGSGCVFLQRDAAALQRLLPAAAVDAILTDLPYGYRTTVSAVGAGSSPVGSDKAAAAAGAAGEGDWRQLLTVLLSLAGHVLAPGGRLLAWLPCTQPAGSLAQQEQQLAECGLQHQLSLLHLLPESCQAGYPRAVALFARQGSSCGSPGGGRQALLAALGAAAASGVPVFNLPAEQEEEQRQPGTSERLPVALPAQPALQQPVAAAAGQQRGLKYKDVRGAVSGTAIDVWRWVLVPRLGCCSPACACRLLLTCLCLEVAAHLPVLAAQQCPRCAACCPRCAACCPRCCLSHTSCHSACPAHSTLQSRLAWGHRRHC